jgi:hypothetical protein
LQAITELLYDTSLVTSGFTVESPKAFADRIYDMVAMVTGSDAFGSNEGGTVGETVEGEVMEK